MRLPEHDYSDKFERAERRFLRIIFTFALIAAAIKVIKDVI